jgi:hypothetical protein
MKSSVFWDIKPCSPLKVKGRFGGSRLLPMLVSCLAYSSTPKMEATCTSEMLVNYRGTRCYIAEDSAPYTHNSEDLKSNLLIKFNEKVKSQILNQIFISDRNCRDFAIEIGPKALLQVWLAKKKKKYHGREVSAKFKLVQVT